MYLDEDLLPRYERFVRERHRAYESRLAGEQYPWCEDEVVRRKKFTNIFRVLDYGSQFVVRELVSAPGLSPETVFIRCMLYRVTNRPEPWEHHREVLGDYPTVETVLSGDTRDLWLSRKAEGLEMMNFRAYTPGTAERGHQKWETVLDLCCAILQGDPWSVGDLLSWTPEHRVYQVSRFRGFGGFLAQQVLTDFHYSPYGADLIDPVDPENATVIDGPGSRRGSRLLAGISQNTKSVIYCLRDMWRSVEDPPLIYPGGTPRPLSLMDVQNTLCEFSKYYRYMGKPPTQRFRPNHNPKHDPPVLPEHWTEYR